MINKEYKLNIPVNDQDHKQGSSDARINLLEYGDYQCPYCGKAYFIIKQLQLDFGHQLQFIFRNFPLTQMHEHAFKAAETAEIAGDEGKFWKMHDLLFEHQDELDDYHLLSYAEKLGIDKNTYLHQMNTQSKTQKIKDDFMSGVESGVNGTPSFYINGYKYEGSWDYHNFKKTLKSNI